MEWNWRFVLQTLWIYCFFYNCIQLVKLNRSVSDLSLCLLLLCVCIFWQNQPQPQQIGREPKTFNTSSQKHLFQLSFSRQIDSQWKQIKLSISLDWLLCHQSRVSQVFSHCICSVVKTPPWSTFLRLVMESVRRKGNNNDNEGWGEKGGYRRTPTQDTPLPLLHTTHLERLAITVQLLHCSKNQMTGQWF